jgi:hypothetical protein
MALNLPPQAQTGDETNRQLTGGSDVESLLANQLSLAEDFQRRYVGMKSYGQTTGTNSVAAMRDLSQRQPGEAPSAIIGDSQKLANSVLSGVNNSAEAAQSATKTLFDMLMQTNKAKQDEIDKLDAANVALKESQRQDEELAMKKLQFKIENGIDPDTGEPTEQAGAVTSKKQAELLQTRKTLKDQGLDTSSIDIQLKTMGIDIEKPVLSKDGQKLIREMNALLEDENLDKVIGSDPVGVRGLVNSFNPKTRTVLSRIKKIQGLIDIQNRQGLKGQGTITDAEMKMLSAAGSILGDIKQDPEAFKAEMRQIITDAGGVPIDDGSVSGDWR